MTKGQWLDIPERFTDTGEVYQETLMLRSTPKLQEEHTFSKVNF